MPEIVMVRSHALMLWGLGIFTLGFLFRSLALWAACKAIVHLSRQVDHYADLYDQSEFRTDRILNSPAYYHAQRCVLRGMESVSPEFRVACPEEA